jgi:16S rRNA (guanine966-N2)-methyltransferase
MRIISGRLKGRSLASPRGQTLRPTADQVKETLFNMIGPQVREARVLDLFAGTGNLGLEALSRGAAQVVFVEKAKPHLACLTNNIALCHAHDQSRVYRGDANHALTSFHAQQMQFDLAFLDPPYRQTNLLTDMLRRMITLALMAEAGLIVVEHAHTFRPPTELDDGFSLTKSRRIGDTALSFYQQ